MAFTAAADLEIINKIPVADYNFTKSDNYVSFNKNNLGMDIGLVDSKGKAISDYQLLYVNSSNSLVSTKNLEFGNGVTFAYVVPNTTDISYVKFEITADKQLEIVDTFKVRYVEDISYGVFDDKRYKITHYVLTDFSDMRPKNPNASFKISRYDDKNVDFEVWNATDLDPTITDVFTSELDGTYLNTTWDSTNNYVRLKRDAVAIIKADYNITENHFTDLSGYQQTALLDVYHTAIIKDGHEAWVTAKHGNGLRFDGANDYVNASQYNITESGNFTVMAWTKPASLKSAYQFIVTAGTQVAKQSLYIAVGSNNKFACGFWGANSDTGFTPTVGQWYHVTATFNGSRLLCYINGTNYVDTNVTSIAITGNDVRIGTSFDGLFDFNGTIDEVILYNCTVNQTEIIKANSTLGYVPKCPEDTPQLAGWFPLNETDGYFTSEKNMSRNGLLNGYIRPAWNVTGGKYLGAYEFDGNDDYYTLSDTTLDFGTNKDFAVSFWIQFNKATANERVLGNFISSPRGGWFIDFSSGKPRFFTRQGAADDYIITANNAIKTQDWNHIVFSVDRDKNITIYVNGSSVASSLAGNLSGLGNDISSAGALFLGKRYDESGAFFNGTLDDIVIFNRTMTAEEVLQIYNGSKARFDYIPSYFEVGNFTRTQGINFAGYNATYVNITLDGCFDNDTQINRDNTTIPDLLYWWTLDNTTEDLNSQKDGTAYNNPIYTSEGFNGSYRFGGTNSANWISLGNLFVVSETANTMCIWTKFENNPSDGGVTARKVFGSVGGSVIGFIFTESTNIFGINFRNESFAPATASISFDDEDPDNQVWIHWCGSIDTTTDGIARLYKNGELVAENTIGPISDVLDQTIAFGIGGDGQSRFYRGKVDEVMYFNRSLTNAEILQIYRDTGSKIGIQTRSSMDNATYSDWYDASPPNLQTGAATVNSSMPNGMYMDYRLLFNSSNDTEFTAFVQNVSKDFNNISITFSKQEPTDITEFNAMNQQVNISYNISAGVNTSTTVLYYKTNTSASDVFYHLNGTTTSGWEIKNGLNGTLENWTWTFENNEIYPATYNYNQTEMKNSIHYSYNLNSTNDYVKVMFYNISNTKNITLLKISTNATNTTANVLGIYYYNSSNVSAKIGSILATDSYNYTNNQSNYHVIPLGINLTDNTLNGVYVTELSYIGIKGTNDKNWSVYYIPNVSRANTVVYSTNAGSTYTNFAGTVDMHINQYNGNETLFYYVSANSSDNTYMQFSTTRNDSLNVTNFPPTAPFVFHPNTSTYSSNSTVINWTASISPIGNGIVIYNVSLFYPNGTFKQVITANNNITTEYIWDTGNATNGEYIIGVGVCDSANLCNIGFSDIFTVGFAGSRLTLIAMTTLAFGVGAYTYYRYIKARRRGRR